MDASIISNAQTRSIDNNNIDFKPLANEDLEKIRVQINLIGDTQEKSDITDVKEFITPLIEPIMQIKAHSGMFKYEALGQIADILLRFVERLEILDSKALEIIQVIYHALYVIIQKELSGDGGPEGQALFREIVELSNHYTQKTAK